jgi:hypothetical protein
MAANDATLARRLQGSRVADRLARLPHSAAFYFSNIFNGFEIELVNRWPSIAQKF